VVPRTLHLEAPDTLREHTLSVFGVAEPPTPTVDSQRARHRVWTEAFIFDHENAAVPMASEATGLAPTARLSAVRIARA